MIGVKNGRRTIEERNQVRVDLCLASSSSHDFASMILPGPFCLLGATTEIVALRGSQGLWPIKSLIKLPIQMAGLKTKDGPVGRHVNREPPVPLEKVLAICGRRANGRLA